MHARWLSGLVGAALLSSGCGGPPAAGPGSALQGSVTVLAAASLTAAFTAIGSDFGRLHPGTSVHFTFAASSRLVAQIQQGAIGDVFASADQPSMQTLVDAGLVTDPPVAFARNRLQIVVGKGNPKRIAGLVDLGRQGLLVVLCAPGVPCGRYAAQALQKAGVSVKPASQEADVKAVLSKVALGEADAGIVYLTDVEAAGSNVQGVEIPPAFNVVAEYPVAVLKDSKNLPLARAFVAYLRGDGQPALTRHGFTRA